jgi:hypothetical protein
MYYWKTNVEENRLNIMTLYSNEEKPPNYTVHFHNKREFNMSLSYAAAVHAAVNSQFIS